MFFLCTDDKTIVACDCVALSDKIFSLDEEIRKLKKRVEHLKAVNTGI